MYSPALTKHHVPRLQSLTEAARHARCLMSGERPMAAPNGGGYAHNCHQRGDHARRQRGADDRRSGAGQVRSAGALV